MRARESLILFIFQASGLILHVVNLFLIGVHFNRYIFKGSLEKKPPYLDSVFLLSFS